MAASADFEKAWALTAHGAGELAPAEDLDQGALVGEAVGVERLRAMTSSRPDSSSTSRLMAWYSTRNGLLKPFSLGTRC